MTDKNRISYIPGTWDLFHVGHLAIIKRAKSISRQITVGVNRDASVLKYKGKSPVIRQGDRLRIVMALACVDFVHLRDYPIDGEHLKLMGYTTIILGSDWKNKPLAGLEEASKILEVIYLPYTKGISTTAIRKKIRKM